MVSILPVQYLACCIQTHCKCCDQITCVVSILPVQYLACCIRPPAVLFTIEHSVTVMCTMFWSIPDHLFTLAPVQYLTLCIRPLAVLWSTRTPVQYLTGFIRLPAVLWFSRWKREAKPRPWVSRWGTSWSTSTRFH